MLPGGSITGCPKIAALDLIAALEPVGRGASMGALGTRLRERRPRPRADDPHVRRRRRPDPPLGRRRHRVGLGPGRRDRGVVGEGAATARCVGGWCRRRRSRAAVAGRGARVDPRDAGVRGRRRGAPARPRGVRDRARLRRTAVPARRAPRAPRASAARVGLPAAGRGRVRAARSARRRRCGRAGARVLRLYWTGRDARRHRPAADRAPTSRSCARRGLRRRRVALGARASLAGAKSTSYAENMAAQDEAAARGADDALLVGARRHRARGADRERLVARGPSALTPSLALPILAGVTRAVLWELAPRPGTRRRRASSRSRAAWPRTRCSSPRRSAR